MYRLQNEIGYRTGTIAAVGVWSAKLYVSCFGEQQARYVESRLLIRQYPRFNIPFIERSQQFVKLSPFATAVVHFGGGLEKYQPLTRFTERLRGMCYHSLADVGHDLQILAQLLIFFRLGHLSAIISMALEPVLHTQYQLFQAIVELRYLRIHFPVMPHLIQKPAPAQIKTDLQIGAEVLDAADARR